MIEPNSVIMEYIKHNTDLLRRVLLLSFENISLIFRYFLFVKNNTPLKMSTIRLIIIAYALY